MERPVIVSDLGAGPDVVLAPPTVPEDRMTGLRFSAGDDAALAAALIRLFSMPPAQQAAIGVRGREWVTEHFNAGGQRPDAAALFRSRGAEKCGPIAPTSLEICGLLQSFRAAPPLTWTRFVPILTCHRAWMRTHWRDRLECGACVCRSIATATEILHSSSHEGRAPRPEGRSAHQRGDPQPRGPADRQGRNQPRHRTDPGRARQGRRRPGSIWSRFLPTPTRRSASSSITASTNTRRRRRPPKPARSRRSSRSRKSNSGR